MGDFSEHVLFGFMSGIILIYLAQDFLSLGFLESFAGSIALAAGSILPDIDHENSYIHRSVRALAAISLGAFLFTTVQVSLEKKFLLGVLGFLTVYITFRSINFRHRGFAHSFSFAAISASITAIASVLFLGSSMPGIAIFLGTVSHLVLDGEFKIS
ncbi:MAG: metal-dependent hydrolase [Candidatus Nanohaloarchaea archaeon]